MVDKSANPRKAAGSSDRFGNSVWRGRSRRRNERPQAPSRSLGYSNVDDEYYEDGYYSHTPVLQTPRLVELLQEAQEEEPRPSTTAKRMCTKAKRNTAEDDNVELNDECPNSNDDWEELACEVPIPNVSANPPTLYHKHH
jgi:hypothetical protein